MENIKKLTRDRIRGSLMAGAAGDALGYPVEFMSLIQIHETYGMSGIKLFDLDNEGKALISDDTQMTLFTANGLLMGITRGATRGICGAPEGYVKFAYIDWYLTQMGGTDLYQRLSKHTWLRDLPEMAHRRAPGNTCLCACKSLLMGKKVNNNSKGCGGLMRVAPMALLMAHYWSIRGKVPYSSSRMDEAGATIAAVTHKHPLGFLPGAMLTHLLYKIITNDPTEVKRNIKTYARETIEAMEQLYPNQYKSHKFFLRFLTERAIKYATNDKSDRENIQLLGEGWTAEEAWAIALYCAMRHVDSVEDAIIAAVNHNGDSDSTGAICGNIMGAIYGYEHIKRHRIFCPNGKELEQTLELSNIILAIADDLALGCNWEDYQSDGVRQWLDRYSEMQPAGLIMKSNYNRAYTPEMIKHLKPNEVFVFGSNLAGKHMGGAAQYALHHFGALWGKGVGPQGQSYAIPTMHGSVELIKPYVDDFILYAKEHPAHTFLVTQIGCGIAGFNVEDIAPLFKDALGVKNILLPEAFVDSLTWHA